MTAIQTALLKQIKKITIMSPLIKGDKGLPAAGRGIRFFTSPQAALLIQERGVKLPGKQT